MAIDTSEPDSASAERVRVHIETLLAAAGIEFKCLSHPPTFTSEESARARGEPLEVGGKALLIKLDERFVIVVLSAAKKLNSTKLKQLVGAKKSRFASAEELLNLTGLVPGSLPPFGEPLFPVTLYADKGITGNAKIAFNAGSLTHSIVMSRADWQSIANPHFADLAD